MRGKRQNIQYSLALELSERGETLVGGYQGTEPPVAKPDPESPALAEQLMEEMCGRENCETAWKHVRKNKGGPGVDGMTIDEAADYLREHWPSIRSQLLDGTHQPQPVKRVEIPKPDGGVRKLGVPCVVDRLVQQAVLQVLQAQWDPTFSEHSYGFRPGRSAHQAVAQAQAYIAEGYGIVVDIDLEKFFDRVNQDRLMARVAERVSDKRVLKLIRAFLKAGVMEDGLIYPVDEGTPQGGPLSPLLSNLVLDELDKELTRRGHRFCRYADDCVPRRHEEAEMPLATEGPCCTRDGGRPPGAVCRRRLQTTHCCCVQETSGSVGRVWRKGRALGASSAMLLDPQEPERKPHSMSSSLSLRSSVFTSTALQKFQRLLVVSVMLADEGKATELT